MNSRNICSDCSSIERNMGKITLARDLVFKYNAKCCAIIERGAPMRGVGTVRKIVIRRT